MIIIPRSKKRDVISRLCVDKAMHNSLAEISILRSTEEPTIFSTVVFDA